MSIAEIPSHLQDLLDRPVCGVLATVGRDDTAQGSPMWFELIDGTIRFTHTTTRAKYRNLLRNPSMSLTIYDPQDPYRYIELRGVLAEAVPDPTGAFYQRLARRYGEADPAAPSDAARRVILVMSIDKIIAH